MAAPMGNVDDVDSGHEESDPDEFDSSKLGTKEYWDTAYERDLETFHDCGDVGEVWFGYDSVDRVVKWMSQTPLLTKHSTILDLGCGNGVLLLEMHKKGFLQLTGVDYAEAAINLAMAISQQEAANITYQIGDILSDSPCCECLKQKYDICLDKGTYDAISLSQNQPTVKRAQYLASVIRLLKDHGLLILTSCNWTADQLVQQFQSEFQLMEKIPGPTFQFGGASGNRETSVVFRKLSSVAGAAQSPV